MSERALFDALLIGFVAIAALVFVLLLFVSAPYGRHARGGWGPRIPSTLGWIVMEAPSPLVFLYFFVVGGRRDAASIAFTVLWLAHYLHRSFVFPFLRRGSAADMPLAVALMAFAFNAMNGYLNGRWLFTFGPERGAAWLADPRFLVGAAVFVAGYVINQQSDHILFHLRKPGETGYKIPRGGLYRFVTSPNYLGEILEWCGFALCTWSPAGAAFAIWTLANLVPRARTHHRWYRDKFADYPPERRAIIPLLY